MSVKLFENETKPLSDYEVNTLVPIIIRGLRSHYGPNAAITSQQMCIALRDKGYRINDVTLRKCVKYIQRNRLLNWIVATANGFFYTEDPRLVKDQIESLRNREDAIRSVRMALEQSLVKIN